MPVAIIGPKFYVYDSNGDPIEGAQIHTFETDGVTRKETFNGENGAANSNPVETNAAGYATVCLDGVYAIVVEDAEGNLVYSENPVTSANELAQVWTNKKTATFATTSSFTIAGNYTDIYKVGRRVQLDDSTMLYGTITASSYSSPNTTVTVSVDDGTLLTANLDYSWVYLFESGDFVEEIANLAALRGITGRTGYNYVYVQSHTNRGDGGNGPFRWVSGAAAATYLDNNGTIIVPTGGDGSAAWVRDTAGDEINAAWFGLTYGTSNDTDAFYAASQAFAVLGGGKYIAPPGEYVVGEQLQNTNGTAFYAKPIITISNCTRPVNIVLDGVKFKMADGLRFGGFDSDGNPEDVAPNYTRSKRADPGTIISVSGNASVVISGFFELDGNLQEYVVGGTFGDTGRQVSAYGIYAYGNEKFEVSSGAYIHSHGTDGVIIGWSGLTESDPIYPHTLINVTSEYNGRQGLSWVGGNNLLLINCYLNRTGRAINTGTAAVVQSAPGAGIDIEAESSICRGGLMVGGQIADNAGVGMLASSGDGGYMTFRDVEIAGITNFSIWPNKPEIRFENCRIWGAVVNAYGSSMANLATQFTNCLFTDEEHPIFGLPYIAGATGLVEVTGNNITFDDCDVRATRRKALYIDGTGTREILRNCRFYYSYDGAASGDFISLIRGCTMEDCEFIDAYTATPATPYYILSENVRYIGKNRITPNAANPGVYTRWGGTSGSSGTYLELDQVTGRPALQIPTRLYVYNSALNSASERGFAQILCATAAPTTGTWSRGDITFNATPSAGGKVGWVCTSGGTPGTWKAFGAIDA